MQAICYTFLSQDDRKIIVTRIAGEFWKEDWSDWEHEYRKLNPELKKFESASICRLKLDPGLTLQDNG